jgi:hypothetical protein
MLVQMVLLYIVAALVTVPLVSAATGIRMELQLLQPVVASISPEKPEIGISKSLDSIPLLKADNIKRKLTFSYDGASRLLVFNQGYGKFQNVTLPATASPASYRQWLLDCQSRRLWRDSYSSQAKKTSQGVGGSLLQFQIPFEVPRIAKSIMGEGGAGLKVSGYRKISFSGSSQWNDQTSIATQKQSKFPSLNMEQLSSFKISGNIGSKISVDVNQDSKRQQSLANRILLRYKGDEDDVVKTLELGNTNLSLPGTRFTGYSRQIQGLFGVKTTAELGGLKLTAIASQEKSSNQGASFKAGTESRTRVIRDNQFLDMTYFDLARRDSVSENDLLPGDSISELDLYFSVNDYADSYQNDKHSCRLFVDPFDTTNSRYANENVQGMFVSFIAKSSTYSNFYFHPIEHYVIMSQPVTGLSIGAYIKYRRVRGPDTTYNEIGSRPDNSTYTLKLIAKASPQPTDVTWNYVWRNVYSLGGRIEDPDNLQVKIYKGAATNTNDRDASDPDNQKGTSFIKLLGLDSDNNGQIDSRNEQIVDLTRGHLRFPRSREPFADDTLSDVVSMLYHTPSTSTDRAKGSKYYLLVNSTSRESEFYLGHSDIVLESETVTLNGKPLKKDVDYRIYYDLGRISFLNQEALNPGADVKVNYEYSPLIAAEKKTLLGARAEYQLGSNLKVGTTVLYKSEKTTDRKPRLGEEQSKSLNLDADISYAFQSNLLTKMVDALPFVETNSPSQISINGEVARSVPNSNASGEAYVDDFEGAREQFSLGVTREGWHPSSIPEQKQSPLTKSGRFIWYNPYDQIAVTDIYDREVKAGENRTNVLVVRVTPNGSDRKPSWGGVMKALSKGSYDQSKIQFIELRMRGSLGVLHLDFGEITEDLPDSNGQTNGKLDTEDRDKNGILDFNEDTGLDLMPDSAEQRECNCTDPDPHGDDWAYDSRDPNNYERINGTEGNGKDPGTNGRPDTEDLDGNGALDTKDNYYSYSIDLATDENVVPNSERVGTGWYTVRIPFTDAFVKKSIGVPSRSNITRVRLWIDGVDLDTAYVEIADLKLTRNVWEVKATLPTTAVRGDSAGLSMAVVNTEENVNYYSPPGVAGFYDRVNKLQEKEQSLSLNYRELLPDDTAYAEKIPYKAEDLTNYRKLAMWVHGDSVRDSVKFFFRFGPDAANYYEYRTTIDSGWSAVDIVFDSITQLKLIAPDTDTTGHPHYRVFGSPSLTRVKYYAMGVINLHTSDTSDTSESKKLVTGELWVDELRTTSVRNDRGLAAVVATSISFGDLGSFRSDYSKQDAFFRNLTSDRSNLGSGYSSTNYGYGADVKLDKFLSSQEKASIPVSYSWRRNESSPRLFTGSDIAVTPDRTEEQKSVSTTTHFQIGESWNKQTRNIIYGALLNRFNSNFSYDKSIARSPTMPNSVSERYTLTGKYAVNSPIKHGLKLLSWLRGMPLLPKRVLGTEFNPFPLRVSLNGTVNRTLESTTNSFNVAGTIVRGTTTNRYLRTFQGRFETGFTPLNSVDVNYNFTTDRDLSDPTLLKFTLDPKQAKLGTERQYSQSFSANYSPQILPFVTGTKFGYSVNHTENVVLTSTSVQETGTRRADNSRSFTANATLDLQKLLGKNQPSTKKAPPKEPPPQKKGKGETVLPDSTGKKGEGKGTSHNLPAKDSTIVPSLDSMRQGSGGPNLPKPPAADSLRDTTKIGDGKKASLNLPKSTGQTSAVVFAEPNPDSGQAPLIPVTPPKDEKKGEVKPPLVIPPVAGDTASTKPDSLANEGSKGKGVGAETPKNQVPTKPGAATSDSTKVKHDSTTVKPDSQKGKPKAQGTPFYGFGLQFVRFFTDRVDPIGGSVHWEKRQSLAGFVQRPSFLYRIGLSDNPNADRIATSASTSQTDLISRGQGYSLRSGVRLILGIKVAAAYAHSTADATGKATRDESTTYPDLTFTFGKLDYLLLPKLFSKSISLDSKYSRQQSTSTSKRYGKLKSRSTATNYSPLVMVKIDWKLAQGLQSTLNYARTISESEGFNDSTGSQISDVKVFANTLSIKTSYSFRGGSKLWLPLFGKIKIQSTLTFDMDISRRLNRTVNYYLTENQTTAERTDFSVVPSVTYNFSTNIKGGMRARWQDSNDIRTKKKSHVRELSFWAEIRF